MVPLPPVNWMDLDLMVGSILTMSQQATAAISSLVSTTLEAAHLNFHMFFIVTVAVYVLDTGIRWTHIDFSGRVGESTSIISNSYWDDHGHGTHVSGTAAGAIHGIAKKATIHAIKVLDSSGSGSYSSIISGMGW